MDYNTLIAFPRKLKFIKIKPKKQKIINGIIFINYFIRNIN